MEQGPHSGSESKKISTTKERRAQARTQLQKKVGSYVANFELDPVSELRVPIKHIIEQLKEELNAGAYGLILGDDASGRIPAFIMGHICQEIAEAKHYPKPHVRFIAGSTNLGGNLYEEKLDRVTKQIAKITDTLTKDPMWRESSKALIVTDTISSGRSVGLLLEALRKNNIEADVATVGLEGAGEKKKLLEDSWNTHVVYGKVGTPRIYGQSRLTGVKKKHHAVFSTQNNGDEYDETLIRAGRHVATHIAHSIATDFLKKKTSK